MEIWKFKENYRVTFAMLLVERNNYLNAFFDNSLLFLKKKKEIKK